MRIFWRLDKLVSICFISLLVLIATVVIAHAEGTPGSAVAVPPKQALATVRIGDLEITTNRVSDQNPAGGQTLMTTAREGYRLLFVGMTVANDGQYPSCTNLDPVLKTADGARYTAVSGSGLLSPQSFNLPPSQRSEGVYVFEIPKQAKPVAVEFNRHPETEDLCAMVQARSPRPAEKAAAMIPIQESPMDPAPASTLATAPKNSSQSGIVVRTAE